MPVLVFWNGSGKKWQQGMAGEWWSVLNRLWCVCRFFHWDVETLVNKTFEHGRRKVFKAAGVIDTDEDEGGKDASSSSSCVQETAFECQWYACVCARLALVLLCMYCVCVTAWTFSCVRLHERITKWKFHGNFHLLGTGGGAEWQN